MPARQTLSRTVCTCGAERVECRTQCSLYTAALHFPDAFCFLSTEMQTYGSSRFSVFHPVIVLFSPHTDMIPEADSNDVYLSCHT